MRIKRGFKARRRRNKVLKLAKGFRGGRGNLFRQAADSVDRAHQCRRQNERYLLQQVHERFAQSQRYPGP